MKSAGPHSFGCRSLAISRRPQPFGEALVRRYRLAFGSFHGPESYPCMHPPPDVCDASERLRRLVKFARFRQIFIREGILRCFDKYSADFLRILHLEIQDTEFEGHSNSRTSEKNPEF